MTATTALAWADELRLGLPGRVRRAGAPVGALRDEWCSLALAVDTVRGRMWWPWQGSRRAEAVAATVTAWQDAGIAALVGDGAPSHRTKLVRAVGVTRITQPAAAPELNPVERVFQELRRAVEGVVYATLAEKVAAVERELTALTDDPERLKRLVGWDWVADSLAQLPAEYPASS